MAFRIKFYGDEPDETVDASRYSNSSDNVWIDFVKMNGPVPHQVLRVRAADVERIDEA